jgi:inorganic triphosphatase YgiF
MAMTGRSSDVSAELEVKFRLPEGAEAMLTRLPMLQPDRGKPEARHEVTTYFDTPDRALCRHGASLRVRRRGTRRVQTLKLPADGPFRRGEWEWPVPTDQPEPARLAGTPAERWLKDAALEPVFVTDVRREVRTLRHGDASIEVALDQGLIRAGDAAEAIAELELELKNGTPESLYRLAAALHAAVPMSLGAESKAARGWRLRTGQPAAAVKQAALDLPREITAAAAFQRRIDAVLATLLANQPAAEAGDVEGVHQMRVAIRRLRATLVLFRPVLEPHAEHRFTEELRRLGRVFGAARDWDVFCTEALPAAEHDGVAPAWVDLLRAPAEAARTAAHARVTAELHAASLTSAVLGLAAWAGDPAALTGDPSGAAMQARLADVAPALLDPMEAKVLRRGRHIDQRPDDALHALRKALKKLR